jgi:hypothetical protein
VNRPATLAEVARRVESGEQRFDYALSEFLDSFYSAPDLRASMIRDRPGDLSDPVQQAMLGAVGEHLALRWHLPVPLWTNEPERFLRRPHFTTSMEGLKALLLAESPVAFRRRLIFTEAEPLRRARMPRLGE